MTDDDLRAARERFAASIPGWIQPEVHGIVTTAADGSQTVQVASGFEHRLPAVVLATVIGRVSGTSTISVSEEQLAEAIERLAPAEAATHTPHPNLWAWRRIIGEGHPLIEAVFVDDLNDPSTSEADQLLRSAPRAI